MSEFDSAENQVIQDQYGNHHRLTQEISRGGQGAVYRTTDPDLAVKITFSNSGEAKDRIAKVRCLPFPQPIPISLPLAVLRDSNGYVMGLLEGMESFRCFDLTSSKRVEITQREIPAWLDGTSDEYVRDLLAHYAWSGSTKRRLGVLAKAAAILARLHSRGIVFGDVSPNNCFVDEEDNDAVWLIDPDNLKLEVDTKRRAIYTPRYGAPEVVHGGDGTRPRTDAWSFAVMAFEILHVIHPFLGAAVEEDDDANWDDVSDTEQVPTDRYERAFAGEFPYIDDANDRSNRKQHLLPQDHILTPALVAMFQDTLGVGRVQPWRRFVMAHWAIELARAHDQSVVCPSCRMSAQRKVDPCPYCGTPQGRHALLETNHWSMVIQESESSIKLPQRLFLPFSLESHHNTVTEVRIDFDRERMFVETGSEAPPGDYEMTVVRGGK